MKDAGTQMHFPGIDPNEERLKLLLQRHPEPSTKGLAQQFFRHLEKDKGSTTSIVAQITMRRDHDLLRLVLKTKNRDENDIKYEAKVELPLDDNDEYERLYVDAAVEAWKQWLRYEKQKH